LKAHLIQGELFYFKMKFIYAFYRMLNALSLDVAGGAIVCAAFFAHLFEVNILPQGFAALGLAVWMVYTADHLLDARKINQTASTFRHRFHQQHFWLLATLLAAALLIELALLFFLRKPLFYNGLWLGLGVMAYVVINRWLRYFKEISGAMLYTCGVLLPAISLKGNWLSDTEKLTVAYFFLIVLTNLILFSWMDYERDLQDQNQSLVTQSGQNKAKVVIWLLFVASFCLSFFVLLPEPEVTIILMLMDIILFCIFLFPGSFSKGERFRYVGDAIFFLPAFVLIG
jgi:hypothetical protein